MSKDTQQLILFILTYYSIIGFVFTLGVWLNVYDAIQKQKMTPRKIAFCFFGWPLILLILANESTPL